MGDHRSAPRRVDWEYHGDRLLATKLAQIYQLLVPDQRWPVGVPAEEQVNEYAAAMYARVSSDHQRDQETIASQTAALRAFAAAHDYVVPPEWVFEDDGYSGAHLVRPGLEGLRDLAASGQIAAVLVYTPDRLSRKYAYQIVLTEDSPAAAWRWCF